ncbi:MAG: hypothetical protein P794_05460 [Epsilonproteobacteria bacterium (ex Lamellibrachia satsuma)]|nr:MAG: hypothetical protein P794_05460 [Epsilonproteobacteria bacterium (ex Lamellibrachia satsuma)]
MIIIGHPWIECNRFCKVFSQEDIKKSKVNDIMLLEPLVDSIDLAKYCQSNDIPYAVTVNTLNEAIFVNALNAEFMICEEDEASTIQPIAEEYLFDTKVLVLIHDEKDISKIARFGIDGVIFAEAIC